MNEDNPATTKASEAGKAVDDSHDGNVIEQEISDEIADTNDDEPSGAAQLLKLKFRIEREGLRYKVEAITRDCLSFAIATSLAIFGNGVVVPPAMGVLMVCVTATFSLMFPSLMFVVFSVHPGIITFTFMFMVYMTILLCAAVVSDGLFVAVFAVMSFLSAGLFFDSARAGVNPGVTALPGTIMALAGQLALTYKYQVQYGLSVDFVPGDDDFSELSPTERTIVSAASSFLDIIPSTTPELDVSFVCPEETGVFAGQTCSVKDGSEPGTLTASVNGGLYVVAAFWTERGINNPLALVSNTMIGFGCWTVASLAIVILFIPPIRKFRDMLRRFIIPGTLEGLATLLESFSSGGECSSSSDVVDPFIAEREKLSVMAKKISPKKNAGMLAFEPRLCHDPAVDYIPPMENFLQNIQSLVLMLYNYRGYHKACGIETPNYSEATKILHTVASAVKENNISILNGVDVPSIEHGLSDMSLAGIINGIVTRIYSSCRTWLHLQNNNEVAEEEKHRVAAVRRTLRAWFTNAMCSCDVLSSSWPLIGLRFLFGRQGAGLEKIGARRFIMTLLWSAKWSVGATALLCIQIYGKDYTDFVIKGEEANSNMAESTAELFGSLQGWELWAYFMAFQFSMEGTIKKGLMRAIGTCLGGFSAWIGIMLCSWSYNGTNSINPYAWIAWLTVNLFVGNFAGKGTGMSAFLGMEYDTPFVSFYYNLTLNIIGMSVFYGSYSINAGTASRILANLSGIAMAMLVSIIPPYYSGKDPRFTIDYCEELLKWHRSAALQYIENREISLESVMQMEDDVGNYRRKAEMIITDAGRWEALTYFRPPPELKKILNILIAEEGYLIAVFKLLVEIKYFQSQDYDLVKPAYIEALEGKDKTAPAISRYLNEASDRNGRLFLSYLNRMARLRVLREKLNSFD